MTSDNKIKDFLRNKVGIKSEIVVRLVNSDGVAFTLVGKSDEVLRDRNRIALFQYYPIGLDGEPQVDDEDPDLVFHYFKFKFPKV